MTRIAAIGNVSRETFRRFPLYCLNLSISELVIAAAMSSRSESESNFPTQTTATRQQFAEQTGASPDICGSLERYAGVLRKWQKRFNLVGPSTLNDIWGRHFLDSAQLLPLISGDAPTIVDLGSGAGFPGLVLSILGAGDVHLVESDANKTEFMRQAIRETGAGANLHRTRIEVYDGPPADVVTSRACAPLPALLAYADAVRKPSATLLLLKGRNWQSELTESQAMWHIDYRCHTSCTDPDGVILEINEFQHR